MKNLAKTVIAVMFCMMISSFSQAQAVELITTTLDFEGITTYDTIDFAMLPDSTKYYGGFNWDDNFGLMSKNYHPGTGYVIGTTSGNYAAFNLYGDVATVSRLEGQFNFISANLTSSFVNNSKIVVEGYLGTDLKYNKDVTLSNLVAQNVQFDFNNIDKLVFKTPVIEGEDTSIFFFAMDDFKYSTAPTPEPSSMILGFLSLSGLMGIRRRKNS
jgi:hypothetical protein